MKVSAEVTIGNGTYDDWLKFFKSYEEERSKFVTNEMIRKYLRTQHWLLSK